APARLTRGPVVKVSETFGIASSRHESPGEDHDRGHIRLGPADGLLQRVELEVGHDRLIGGHGARASDESDGDGDREYACEPVRGTHPTSSHHGGGVHSIVSTQKELKGGLETHVYTRPDQSSRLPF